MNNSDIEYKVLKTLEKNPHMTQREVSKELGVSLGKTNYVIRALVNKGWIKLTNFKRSNNKLAYLYILTPDGINNKSKLTQLFLTRKVEEYNKLKEEIKILQDENEI